MIDLNRKIENELVAIDKKIRQAANERDESATPMESTHDQTRQIANQLYNSLLEEKKRLMELTRHTSRFHSIFHVQNLADNSIKKYFVVPNGLGGTQENDVVLLSEKTPLAKMIGDNVRGYVFELNGQRYRIEKIEENN